MPRMIRAIVFDFDGVIADTEPLHCRAFTDLLAPRGIAVSREDYFSRYVGLRDPDFLQRLFADLRRPLGDDDLAQLLHQKDEIYMSMIAGGIDLLPGVAEFVTRQVQGRPLAICSGARRVEIETILRAAGLLWCFPIIVCSDDVPISKPDPAGFLRAWELLREKAEGLCPGQCLAIEDSPHGVTAAKAAGMAVLAVQSQCTAAQLSAADLVVPDLRSITEADILRM